MFASPEKSPADRPRPRLAVICALFALTAVAGVLPWWLIQRGVWSAAEYPLWGFSPILPLCLYAGAFVRNRAAAVALPPAAWAVQGLAQASWWGDWSAVFSPVMGWVYGCLIATAIAGLILRRHRGPATVAALGLGSAVAFFLVTNFGVWLGGAFYPQTFEGLLACYAAGVPFFRGTLLSVAVFVPALFWLPQAAARPAPAPAPAAA